MGKTSFNFKAFKMGCGLREAFGLVTILLSNVVKDIYLKLKISKPFTKPPKNEILGY